jgi:hypothetical protein
MFVSEAVTQQRLLNICLSRSLPSNGSTVHKVNIKLSTFQRMCRRIRRTARQESSQSTQIQFCKAVSVPLLTYASGNWTVRVYRSCKRKIVELWFLRLAAGYTLLDQKRSTDIRSELQISSLTEGIERQKDKNDNRYTAKDFTRFKPRGQQIFKTYS